MESVPITVIITAYNRERFILDAINSALNQTLNKNLYELIVVSNFENEELSHICKENGIKFILSNNNPLGDKIKEGIINTQGKVICFLEDDDQFMPDKLNVIYKKMVLGKIVYYHNRHIAVDENGSGIKYADTPAYANLSSMSIKRDLIPIEALDKITNLEFLFYLSALNSGNKIVKYGKWLSKYMVHPSDSHKAVESVKELRRKREATYAKMENERKILSALFTSGRAGRCIRAVSTSNEIEMFCLDANKKPKNIISYFLNRDIMFRKRINKLRKYILTMAFPKKMNKYFVSRLNEEVKNSNKFSETPSNL